MVKMSYCCGTEILSLELQYGFSVPNTKQGGGWQGFFWADCLDFFTAVRPAWRSSLAVGRMAAQLFEWFDFLIITAQDHVSLWLLPT